VRDKPFSYACAGRGRCCFEKRIVVSSYEIARIADVLALSTTEVIQRYTIEGGTVLRQREDGGCSLLDGTACGVHGGRPLVCRLYPLGRMVQKDEAEQFITLRGHPQSEGKLGEDGTIGAFLEAQGTEPYTVASARYFALFTRLMAVLQARQGGIDSFQSVVTSGAPEDNALEWLDIDATLARRAEGEIPTDVEARVALHLSLFEREIAALEAERTTVAVD
jgi:Fe-S-cluster containining protein